MEKFIEQVLLTGPVPPALTQALEKTKVNIGWIEKNKNVIISWLNNRGFNSELVIPDPTLISSKIEERNTKQKRVNSKNSSERNNKTPSRRKTPKSEVVI